ncbi:NOG1 family protein [Hyperthermus butylicus]|uniref:NOG1 family protein n=1 Tax=Hyperthermus butylicus TaxID=54248 RepID=UPI0018911FAD|nr:GTPase [Hyperthermus butylicus]
MARQLEAQKIVETVRRLREVHVYTADEIVRIVGERYRRIRRSKPGLPGKIEFEIKRLEVVFNVAYSRLQAAAKLPTTREMSEFHRVLVESFVGREYDEALRRIRRALKLVKNFWAEYRLLIASAESAVEAARLRKEGSGRILSVVRRLRKHLELVERVRRELLKTHVVAEGLPVVVVAGIPSAGKSTLVRRISTAEPEIASYPFTTKSIIVGKARHQGMVFYVVDTPGILERPLELHNEIERKALAALKTLPDIVLVLLDPSPEKVQSLENQERLLRSIYEGIVKPREAGLIIAVNKVDASAREEVEKAIEMASSLLRDVNQSVRCVNKPIPISALHGQGVGELLDVVIECLKRKTPWLFPGAEPRS